MHYYHDIKRDFPLGDFKLCENGFRHAFVLDAGREVAEMVFEWIREDLRSRVPGDQNTSFGASAGRL